MTLEDLKRARESLKAGDKETLHILIDNSKLLEAAYEAISFYHKSKEIILRDKVPNRLLIVDEEYMKSYSEYIFQVAELLSYSICDIYVSIGYKSSRRFKISHTSPRDYSTESRIKLDEDGVVKSYLQCGMSSKYFDEQEPYVNLNTVEYYSADSSVIVIAKPNSSYIGEVIDLKNVTSDRFYMFIRGYENCKQYIEGLRDKSDQSMYIEEAKKLLHIPTEAGKLINDYKSLNKYYAWVYSGLLDY